MCMFRWTNMDVEFGYCLFFTKFINVEFGARSCIPILKYRFANVGMSA